LDHDGRTSYQFPPSVSVARGRAMWLFVVGRNPPLRDNHDLATVRKRW
jgi:hypothetical protein